MSISPSYPRDSVSLLPSTCTRVYMIRERVKEGEEEEEDKKKKKREWREKEDI